MIKAFFKGILVFLLIPVLGSLFILGFLVATIIMLGGREDGIEEFWTLYSAISDWWEKV